MKVASPVQEFSLTTSLSCRILLVDDFQPWRQFLFSLLGPRKQLQVVGEAQDGSEAIQKAKALKPDLVLLDIGLPNLNGIEAASQIHRANANARIIFVSENNDPDIVTAALRNGAHGFVRKADARRELLPAIEAVLRGERFVNRRLNR